MVTKGFTGRGVDPETEERLPRGQHVTQGFPVLSATATPKIDLNNWKFQLKEGLRPIASWTWLEFNQLPRTVFNGDIHCVTSWSKFDTSWEGISIDDIFAAAGVGPLTPFVLAECYGGYTTNVPTADLVAGKAIVATMYGGRPLPSRHGGPARLLVPHLYFWKSAKWCSGLMFTKREEAGFWERQGFHMRGDPWKEQRFSDDL
ncbi:sulfite oxidase-like oxidoreductase [Hydrogenophaga intermedia]|uniref:sulfite oxidase-like oxidoreductase n=1 Tax=Hydrogenophaga intermedia TaxID=65786 RepID=UPI002044A47F|nr:sulfite oxidase-like oxidoreductase [Hydrogenophaga intermedia]MCM3566258.1 sulfite oxidase-like oxidoreductase [Hydrogenophaga intermedia]